MSHVNCAMSLLDGETWSDDETIVSASTNEEYPVFFNEEERYPVQCLRLGDGRILDGVLFQSGSVYGLCKAERNQWVNWWPLIFNEALIAAPTLGGKICCGTS